ncbi:MAG: LamB/YcsF family protein [Bacilli bacterium]
MSVIDINADLGEAFGRYRVGDDDALLAIISSANIACGFHAGDPHVMARTVSRCAELGVRVGAHPGFPDLQGFGRRRLPMSAQEIRDIVLYQVGALALLAESAGAPLHHVKLHGALNNWAAYDPEIAAAVVAALRGLRRSPILYAPAGSPMVQEAIAAGQSVWQEIFADRNYEPDGALTERTHPRALLRDPDDMAQRVLRALQDGVIRARTGDTLSVAVDTICVHGDEPTAVAAAKAIRNIVRAHGYTLAGPAG